MATLFRLSVNLEFPLDVFAYTTLGDFFPAAFNCPHEVDRWVHLEMVENGSVECPVLQRNQIV
jgi:hypothetical protein